MCVCVKMCSLRDCAVSISICGPSMMCGDVYPSRFDARLELFDIVSACCQKLIMRYSGLKEIRFDSANEPYIRTH